MGKYFGTDGFRGEAGITLTADHAYKVGRFLGWYYNALRERNNDHEPARIVIGKDTRRSSYMFEYSLVAGLTASGADAYLLHVTTTPSVAYIARVDDFDCGIMISASHNPYYDNGIKLIDCYGEKMPEETLLLVEDYIDGKLHVFDQDWPELPFAHREHIGCTVDYVAGRNRYMGYLISLGIYSFKGVKVGLDCANGSSWNIAKSVFDALGADTYVINAQPNGTNINNNAGSTHIEGLQKFVVEKGLDVGFAYDGDADRCLCVDEKGNVITGDHILYIYGCYMKERGKLLTNTVVTTVMSNFGLYKAFDEQGIGYAKTAVGDKYVYEYMAKNGCRIGGEQSGHIIFSKYASTGDGILTSLKMMEVMLAKKKPMSELAAPLKIYPQVLENIRVTDKKAAQNDPAVQEAVNKVAEALGDTGRILVRESGTEPVVRVMVEAPDHDVCQKYVDEVIKVINDKGYDPKPENMPTLGDLYDCLREQKERQAQRIATALEIYVNGSLRVFNHQTNVELDNRIICFDIKELGKQLKKLGMLIVQDQVWNRVTINRNSKKNTRYYIDEFHLLLKEEQTAAYSVEIWKRFRKWGGVPTGITQNIKDLLASREIENIFENSDFIYMLNQASGDRQILAKQLNISPFQLSYVTNSNEGEGLLFYGNTIIPFKDKFDTSLKLYSLMTTKPNEMGKYKEKKEA